MLENIVPLKKKALSQKEAGSLVQFTAACFKAVVKKAGEKMTLK